MAGEWCEAALGDVIELKRGYDLPRQARSPGAIPIVSSSGVSDYHSEAKVSGPGVITGRYGTLGEVFYVGEDFWPLNTTLYVRDFKGNDPRFVGYFLRSIDFLAYSDKAAVPGVNRNHLHQACVCYPGDPAEQHAIAHILSTLDDKIELNRRMNETLEEMARALFKSWFVDFDPVRAKMEGRQPFGMDEETAALFPGSFEDSALGEIPKGWVVGTVGDDFDITMGQSPPGETYNEIGEGLPFYQGRRDFKFRYPTLRVYCSAPKRTARYGDALVSVRAPVGDVNMAESVCCVGRGVAAVRHKTSSRSYTYYAMRSLKSYFERFESEGTVFGAVNKQGFLTIPFLLPPPALVKTFESLIFPLDQRIEVQEKQSRTLAAIRDALLPKLLSGEVRVGQSEEIVEDVV